jgi:GAF domain-containing protein
MPQEGAFGDSLSALSQFFVGDKTMQQTLDRVAEVTTVALPAAEFVGITMTANGRPQTAVFTDRASPEIDQAQYDADSGPCLDAFRTGNIHRIDSMERERRWPEFRHACLDHGVLSTLSLPLTVEETTYGALNLYATSEHAFDNPDTETAALFGAQAAIVLANAFAYWSARGKSEQLEAALASRAVIEQAKGIIMSTMRCSPDEAFGILAKQSQQQNRKLREIAAEIVTSAGRRP